METLFCPYTRNCEIYQTYKGDGNCLNIIANTEQGYQCFALSQLKSRHQNGTLSEDLESSAIEETRGCSHIRLLNLLNLGKHKWYLNKNETTKYK